MPFPSVCFSVSVSACFVAFRRIRQEKIDFYITLRAAIAPCGNRSARRRGSSSCTFFAFLVFRFSFSAPLFFCFPWRVTALLLMAHPRMPDGLFSFGCSAREYRSFSNVQSERTRAFQIFYPRKNKDLLNSLSERTRSFQMFCPEEKAPFCGPCVESKGHFPVISFPPSLLRHFFLVNIFFFIISLSFSLYLYCCFSALL